MNLQSIATGRHLTFSLSASTTALCFKRMCLITNSFPTNILLLSLLPHLHQREGHIKREHIKDARDLGKGNSGYELYNWPWLEGPRLRANGQK